MHAYWAHYHGGLASPIWIANMADSSVAKVPHENATDFNPMWVGNKISSFPLVRANLALRL